jgi:hypothetical protein
MSQQPSNLKTDQSRREKLKRLMGQDSAPAFAYKFMLNRKQFLSFLDEQTATSDNFWIQIQEKTGLPPAFFDDTTPPDLALQIAQGALRTDEDRLYLLDALIGDEKISDFAQRHGVTVGSIRRFFIPGNDFNLRHATHLAEKLGLESDYFLTAPIKNPEDVRPKGVIYEHRVRATKDPEQVSAVRLEKLNALLAGQSIFDFCRYYRLDYQLISRLTSGSLSMTRVHANSVCKALTLQPSFFDRPMTELDQSEILSVQQELDYSIQETQTTKSTQDILNNLKSVNKKHR